MQQSYLYSRKTVVYDTPHLEKINGYNAYSGIILYNAYSDIILYNAGTKCYK